MLLVALNGSIAIVDFKLEAKKLKKLSAGTLRHGHCLELLSRLFGYKNWHDANQNVKAGRLMNRRTDRGRISMKMFDVAGQN
ncbi:hypothetical protein SAMN04488595_107320 [Ralstonia sp. 25mfcol4.1]|nr:hypothetical protein SAMN04488595_107320 [Ralstonia sp. 25mfcol4.1]